MKHCRYDIERQQFVPHLSFNKALAATQLVGFGAHASNRAGLLASDYDGVNDYGEITPATLGVVDSKVGTVSLWVNFDGGDGVEQRILFNDPFRFLVRRTTTNRFEVRGSTSTPALTLRLETNASKIASGGWFHLMCAWDLGAGTGEIYVNGSDDEETFFRNLTDNLVDNSHDWGCGARATDGSSKLDGKLSEVWFDDANTLLPSSHLSKFYSVGKPVPVGADGSGPLSGAKPLIYFSDGDPTNNKGRGGNFTLNGALDSVDGPGV